MNVEDAAALIAAAVGHAGETWADLGAGSGTFTLALARLLGPAGRVVAVDRDPAALAALAALRVQARTRVDDGVAVVSCVRGDFTRPLDLPPLDGALLANALHFVPAAEQPRVVEAIARHLRPGGRLAVVEYEGRPPSRWVPHPVSLERFATLARAAGLAEPARVGSRRSAFGGTMYAAVAGRA